MCEDVKKLEAEIARLEEQVQQLWARETAYMTREKMRKEARERIRRRKLEGQPPTQDWQELNEAIEELVFRTDWSDDDWEGF